MNLPRTRAAAALTVLAAALAGVAVSVQPSAAHPPGGTVADARAAESRYRIINRLSGKCLVVANLTDGSRVTQRSCDRAGPSQWWTLDTGGVTRIVNDRTSRCLDLWANSADNGTRVNTYDCRGDDNWPDPQLWRLVHKGEQYWEIHTYGPDKCLDLANDNRNDGALIQQWGCNWGWNFNQQWQIVP